MKSIYEHMNNIDDEQSLRESSIPMNESSEKDEINQIVSDHFEWALEELGSEASVDDYVKWFIDISDEADIVFNRQQRKLLRDQIENRLKAENDDIDETDIVESVETSWLEIQNKIALEQQEGINPFYDESAAGDYIYELMGKVETELDIEVLPSVQGGVGDVYIHLGSSYDNVDSPVGPINFTTFCNELIDLVLEADNQNEFIRSYKENISAYLS